MTTYIVTTKALLRLLPISNMLRIGHGPNLKAIGVSCVSLVWDCLSITTRSSGITTIFEILEDIPWPCSDREECRQ